MFSSFARKMDNFLSNCKKELECITQHSGVCVVLGNQSCDLDSAVCALLFARYLKHTQEHGDLVLPLLNVSQADFPLKTEVKYYLNKFGITKEHLLFREDIDLNSLKEQGKLKLVLVDHNVLTDPYSELDGAVVQIVDHHLLEHTPCDKIKMMVETVGSCSTLVAGFFKTNAQNILDLDAASLLLGPIIVDTANFSPSVKLATAKDNEAYDWLVKLVPAGFSKDELYLEILTAKEDISELTMKQLLNKDAKNVHTADGTHIFVSGFPCLSANLLEKYSDVENTMQDHCKEGGFEAGVLLGMKICKTTNTMVRDLVVFSRNQRLKNQLCNGLEQGEPNLMLKKLSLPDGQYKDCVLYQQGNVTATRKKIIPLLKFLVCGN